MYLPKHFEERDVAVLQALMRAHPLGTWVTQADDGLAVNHVPFLVDSAQGEYGVLRGHVARANPAWQALAGQRACVVVFQGPQAYITPSWYPTKQAHGRAVPTWNYAVVHAHGVPRAIEDRDWLISHVTAISAMHESGRAVPWRVSDAPADYIDAMLKAIVGIEIPIHALVGKWKTSQNRPHSDQVGIVAGLHEQGDASSRQMAELVQRHVAATAG